MAEAGANPILRFFGKFTVLRGGMRELWLSFVLKFLIIAGYGVMNSTLVLWFSSDFGLSDQQALGLVGAWSLIMTIFTILSGSLTDALGFRNTFFLGVGLSAASRLVMVFSSNLWVALGLGLFPLAVGEALTGPVLIAATRTYSNTKQRSISFSLIYSIMNIGFLAANLLFDDVRSALGEHGHFGLLGVQLTTYQALLLVSFLIECATFPLICFIREGAVATDGGVQISPQKPTRSAGATVRDAWSDTARIFTALVRQPGFYRLLAFLLFVAFLKLIYRQLDYVFPKFSIRMLGDGVPVGKLVGINNIIIVFLTPVVGALTERFSAYKMVILGGALAASSIFIMALPPTWFQPLTVGIFGKVFGHWYLGLKGAVDPYYGMIAVFVTVLSFGEAFYSPRVYEYAAAIAPAGQEASYSALSYVPFLLAKLLTGTFSGTLLATYCPEHGVRRPEIMWLIIGAASTTAPIGLALLGRFIRLREAGRSA